MRLAVPQAEFEALVYGTDSASVAYIAIEAYISTEDFELSVDLGDAWGEADTSAERLRILSHIYDIDTSDDELTSDEEDDTLVE